MIVDATARATTILGDPRPAVTDYIHAHKISEGTYPSLAVLVKQIADEVQQYGSLAKTPTDKVQNVRNDMYTASEAIRVLAKDKESELKPEEVSTLNAYKKELDVSTKFIPSWVKICVAIALGLGTMIGWKRIVVTVGEKIGKTHLTYGQGARPRSSPRATIGAADGLGLPVSTTHVLSSGVAGTMAANGSGMQWSTLGNIALAWVLTLPAAMLLSGTLYFIFRHIFLTRPPAAARQLEARRRPARSTGDRRRPPRPARRAGDLMATLEDVLSTIDANQGEALDRLFALLAIPSVSAVPAHFADCARAADWLTRELADLGFEAARHDTAGRPMVVGDRQGEDPRRAERAVLRPLRRPAGRPARPCGRPRRSSRASPTGRAVSASSPAAPATTKAS